MKDLNEDMLDAFLTSGGPKVLDVYAPWCKPCGTVMPLLEELAEEYGGLVEFAKINYDKSDTVKDMLNHFKVMGIPAILVMGNDKGGFLVGVQGIEEYRRAIEQVLEAEA